MRTSIIAGIFFLIYFVFVFGISIAMYLLQAFGIYRMAKNMGFPNAWLAFIPIANNYTFGKVAETYIKPDGRPSARFSKILLTLQIILFVLLTLFVVFIVILVIFEYSGTYIMSGDAQALTISAMVIPFILVYLGIVGVSIAFSVVYYVALWRIFALYNYKNATLFLVLSIFISFLYPIFIFVLRNKQPMFTMEQRVNQQ